MMTKEILKLAANEAAAKALYETWHSQPEYKPWQDGGNSHKQDEARELVRLAHKLKPPLPEQEPVAYDKTEMNSFVIDLYDKKMKEGKHGHYEALFHCVHQAIAKVTPPAAQRKPLTDDVLVPLEVLEAAASSLDSFCGDLGWGDADLQNMDNLFAVIEQHKAAHNIKEKTND